MHRVQQGVYGRTGRAADPRERVRKESEPSSGIVLSPQRRSFTSGCGAPAAAPPPHPHLARTRPDSPLSHPPHQPLQKTEQGQWRHCVLSDGVQCRATKWKFKKIIVTLYPIHSRIGTGNLVLRHSIPHFPLNSGSATQRHALPQRQNEKVKI